MIQRINFQDFIDSFRLHNKFDQFGFDALSVLFDYLETLERDMNNPLELDVIGLCCDYSHNTCEDIIRDYSIDVSECDSEESIKTTVDEYLQENTIVCGETDNGFVYCTSF
jgi:hypothetical protein